MNATTSSRARAVLDTSFWVAAYRAEVAANCLDLFEIVVPRAVEEENRRPQATAPSREYPYATLFRHLRNLMFDPPESSPKPIILFGAGEAEAIVLSGHLNAVLLVNERRGARYAENLNLRVVTVPTVIVTLRVRQVISSRTAYRKLDLIEPITAAEIVAEARRAVDLLSE